MGYELLMKSRLSRLFSCPRIFVLISAFLLTFSGSCDIIFSSCTGLPACAVHLHKLHKGVKIVVRYPELRSKLFNDFPEILELVREYNRNTFEYHVLSEDDSDEARKRMQVIYDEGVRISDALSSFRNDSGIPDASDIVDEAHRVLASERKRRKNLVRRVRLMFEQGPCVFVTLTFTDDALTNLSKQTRRHYVNAFLSACAYYYVANIDYSPDKHREHYHAVLCCKDVDMSLWKYGFVFAERIKRGPKSARALGHYICKLVNHALKGTDETRSLIYSRYKTERFVWVPDPADLPF